MHLTALHAELESVKNLDEELHEELRQLAADIEKRLAEEEPLEVHSWRARLKDMAVRFEAEHPRLAGTLGEVADTLGKLGI